MGLTDATPITSKFDPRKPRTSRKQTLASLLMADPRLSKADKQAIEAAYETGVTVQDLAALVCYEIRMARAFFETGELAAKDLLVALTKAGAQAAACAQLAQTSTAVVPSRIEITFDASQAPRAENGLARPQPTETGDQIEVA